MKVVRTSHLYTLVVHFLESIICTSYVDLKDSQDSEDYVKLTEVREEVIKKYNKFSNARKDFKQAAREKMKSSVADEEDPALISKYLRSSGAT